jgi:hypothetical protein
MRERLAVLRRQTPASAQGLVLVDLLNVGGKAQRQGAISEEQFLAIGEIAPTLFSELVPAAGSTAAAQGAASSAGGGSGDGDRAVAAGLRVP